MSETEFSSLPRSGAILAQDQHGWKVLEDRDGQIWKRFRRKGLFSSAALLPYAVRFADNATRLKGLGFRTVEVSRLCKYSNTGEYLVAYPKLSGQTIREIAAMDDPHDWQTELAGLFSRLHQTGVYFRALHLGNILRLADGRLALIDIADVRFRRGPLGWRARSNNFDPMLRYADDWRNLEKFGLLKLLNIYLRESGLRDYAKSRFLQKMGEKYGGSLA